MKKILLIRHGAAAGNLEGRYVGRTDEPLCPEGISKLEEKKAVISEMGDIRFLFTSPYRRCLETVAVFFPSREMKTVPDLRECDFGDFEEKNAKELESDPRYEKWVAENCRSTIPGGENPDAFKERCCAAFEKIMQQLPEGAEAAVVTHGGCIMAILEKLGRPKKEFYEYHIGNGGGFVCIWDGGCLTVTGGF